MISRSPETAANIKAVLPFLSLKLTLALASSKISETKTYPFSDASIKAVIPLFV
jgi:hypothetical protein